MEIGNGYRVHRVRERPAATLTETHTIILRGSFMGKSIALFFACAALVIMAGSFMAPSTVAAGKGNCAPAYGVDPCSTGSVSLAD